MYYRDEILGILARSVPGIAGILIIKYTYVLDFLEHRPNFDLIFILIILLFLEGVWALLSCP